MDLLYWIIIVVAVILVGILGFFLHLGLLYTPIIRLSHPASMPKRVAYVLKQGPYKECGPEFSKLQNYCGGATMFGAYYDDPDKVAQDKLRYIVGCCLPYEEGSELEENLASAGYKTFEFPECQKAVITEFPCKNMLSMFLAIWKVYPELKRFFNKHHLTHKVGPCLEVYEKSFIRFYAPLEDNEKYFVPGVEPHTMSSDKKED